MKTLAWLLSFFTGFLSLSQEVVWVRIVGFANQSTPYSFSLVLALFLLGIALGASLGKILCSRFRQLPLLSGLILLFAGLSDLALCNIMQMASPAGSVIMLVLVIFTAAGKATMFPIVHQMGSASSGKRIGRSVSKVYFMNILGSTTAPVLTGMFLMDHFPVATMMHFIGTVSIAVATFTLTYHAKISGRKLTLAFSLMAMFFSAAIFPYDNRNRENFIARLAEVTPDEIRHVIENRHGIIHVIKGHNDDDVVYGGNVYDGRTNIDLRANDNRVDRTYLLHALHPAPRRILVIGLSSGAWTRILSLNDSVDEIDAVEINPGYLELIRKYPEISPILEDRRITIHIDDGRRWLKRHSQARYDLIVMNATFHWRANITNLLSREMLELLQNSLAPRGILAFNATGSSDAFFTATTVFPKAFLYRNFVYCAGHDFRSELTNGRQRLLSLRMDGKKVFNEENRKDMLAIESMLAIPFVSINELVPADYLPEVITDQNMISEFKHSPYKPVWFSK